jgi:hypothetical protein
VNEADTPLNRTAFAPVKRSPLIVTVVPTAPLVGENELTFGTAVEVTVKFPELRSVPLGVVTEIFPFVAPAGTVAVIRVSFTTEKLAETPLNLTDVAPVNRVPLIVTDVPTGPLVGLKLVMLGAWPLEVTVKVPELCTVPFGVVTEIGPVVAPEGTVAVICVPAAFTLNPADAPLNLTADASWRFVPLIVTDVPTGPLVGLKLLMVGPDVTMKLLPVCAVPSGVVTEIGPVVAPDGTVAMI